jgi:hypothetical protein
MDETKLEKARLLPMKADLLTPDSGADAQEKIVVVQFNPETLKVSYANQLEKPEGSGDQRGKQAQQFVGSGSSKLSCTLWFDVSAAQPKQNAKTANGADGKGVDDVRKLTGLVTYYMRAVKDKKDPKKFVPTPVRFAWGSFYFDGIMDSLEESLELFSSDGRPLRASVAISISQQEIVIFPAGATQANGKPAPGTTPTSPTEQGTPLQKKAGENWQGTAQANKVENPRLPPTGQRLNMQGG